MMALNRVLDRKVKFDYVELEKVQPNFEEEATK
jgi:hypothetical protein